MYAWLDVFVYNMHACMHKCMYVCNVCMCVCITIFCVCPITKRLIDISLLLRVVLIVV